MMYLLTAVISFVLGGVFGVSVMCLFQINRNEWDKEPEIPPVKEAE